MFFTTGNLLELLKRLSGLSGGKTRLVGYQFKSYTCLNGVCQNNYKPSEWHISPNMDEHQKFCDLLCQDPRCTDPQGWR